MQADWKSSPSQFNSTSSALQWPSYLYRTYTSKLCTQQSVPSGRWACLRAHSTLLATLDYSVVPDYVRHTLTSALVLTVSPAWNALPSDTYLKVELLLVFGLRSPSQWEVTWLEISIFFFSSITCNFIFCFSLLHTSHTSVLHYTGVDKRRLTVVRMEHSLLLCYFLSLYYLFVLFVLFLLLLLCIIT